MAINVDLNKTIIISDFDGTISTQDTNDLLFKTYGNSKNEQIENLYKRGKIGTKEGMLRHFQEINIDEENYSKFVLNKITLDSGFKRFYKMVREHNIPFIVVSGGFINAINLLFKRENIELKKVYANKLLFHKEGISIEFLHKKVGCNSNFGDCGNCKLLYLESFKKEGKQVIFIGDGLTDRCIAEKADIVFAKKKLKEYCVNNGIKHIEYRSFNDISKILFECENYQ